jgi:hypothetical protein
MSAELPQVAATANSPAVADAALECEGVVRERVSTLFRKRGVSVEMRALEQSVLEYRLGQQR